MKPRAVCSTLANVPPIFASPPASNVIAFSGNASYEKMRERDVGDAIDKRMSVCVMTQLEL